MMSIKPTAGAGEEEEEYHHPLFDYYQKDDEEEVEHVLSQKLSQLSTSKKEIAMDTSVHHNKRACSQSATPMKGSVSKKMKKEEEEDENSIETIPTYLSLTNPSFTQMLEQQSWFRNHRTDHHVDELRYLAILMHKITVINLQRDLWLTYVKSGTGRLKKSNTNEPNSSGPSIWPVKVKSLILSKRITTEMKSDDENQACRDLVYQFLSDLNVKQDQYQQQLMGKKQAYRHYTDSIGKDLQTYIEQQGLYFLRLKCDLKQALVNNDYQDQMFEMNYRQLNPNDDQVRIEEDLCN